MAQHLSIRVPWKDNGYSGLVCEHPCRNTSCLRLKNIAENRNDDFEDKIKNTTIKGHEALIPCVAEGGCFMSEQKYSITNIHPYKRSSKLHKHFLPTELVYPPFSLPARPFGWTLLNKDNNNSIEDIAEKYGIDYDSSREPDLDFITSWVQDADNQRAIFKSFFDDVIIGESIVIPYAKQVPFSEDSRRIVIGIGYVTSITEPPEHAHTEDGDLRSILWETMIGHSIRNDRKNGFIMPYREMMKYAEEHPDFDISSITVYAEDEYFNEFSYATEHLSYDAVINVLNQAIKALKIIKECIPGNWNECIRWAKEQLRKVWLDRGPFPGLGSMLRAFGFRRGEMIARQIRKNVVDFNSYEDELYNSLKNPKEYYTPLICKNLEKNLVSAFISLPAERKELFWLLSRMSISENQAIEIFDKVIRSDKGIECTDEEIINNPYVIYESMQKSYSDDIITVKKIDMAMFPATEIQQLKPIIPPSLMESENDKRRIRAYVISLLEEKSLVGHTVYPINMIINELNNYAIEHPCYINDDIMKSIADFMQEELVQITGNDSSAFYQLNRYSEIDSYVRKSIEKRINGQRHIVNEDWRSIVDKAFSGMKQTSEEERARTEKTEILKELAESRLSVLIGGAGTGKTTLLSLLCKSSQIENGGVLLLAPTGKARVRMSQAMIEQGVTFEAQTIAQFLIKCNHYDWKTNRYFFYGKEASGVPDTVIIDESSMLTEEMFGALIKVLSKKVKRLIFVGDPNQLPPIGAGRPFVDLVKMLSKGISEFPKVGKGFGQLTVTVRQLSDDGEPRLDTELSKWFASDTSELDDSVFAKLNSVINDKYLLLRKWETAEELEQLVFETIKQETKMKDIDDRYNFDLSIGGAVNNQWMNFGSYPKKVESWQIITPYRNDALTGSAAINRYVHEKYRSKEAKTYDIHNGMSFKVRGTRNVLGSDGIVFGDKVINLRNQKKDAYDNNAQNTIKGYVANGEVGIVERIWEKPKNLRNTHQVRFSSQPELAYNWNSVISDNSDSDLELAYALTVHKSQGSEFEKAILVLGEPSGMISKEMLYTAITRQRKRLVILYNEQAYRLRDYSSAAYSETARRFTALFESPKVVEIKKKYYEDSLIHRTLKGELVRSKSEVIIANMLFEKGIEYEYEKELDLGEDGIRIPDFTIDDAESGTCFYWEHCGMLGDKSYLEHWEKKKEIYKKHGIIEGKNLIVSQDTSNGGIDSSVIHHLIIEYLE